MSPEAEQRTVSGMLRVYHNFQSLLDDSERDTLTGLLRYHRCAAAAGEPVLVAGSLFLIAAVREGLLAGDGGRPQLTADCPAGSPR